MESIEFRSGAQGLSILSKQCLGCCCRIDHDHGDVSQLDLIHTTMSLRPLAILLGGVLPNLPQVPDQRKPAWASKTRDSSCFAEKFVHDEIQDARENHRDSKVTGGVVLGTSKEVPEYFICGHIEQVEDQ